MVSFDPNSREFGDESAANLSTDSAPTDRPALGLAAPAELVSVEQGLLHYSPAHNPLLFSHFRQDLARYVTSKILAEMEEMMPRTLD